MAFEILKMKLEHQHKLQTAFLTVSSMLLAIAGALLKFTFDARDLEGGYVFPLGGVILSGYAFLLGFFAIRTRQRIEDEVATLNEACGSPVKHADFPALRYTIIGFFVFSAIVALSFATLLIFPLKRHNKTREPTPTAVTSSAAQEPR